MWEGVQDKVTDAVFRMEEAEAFQESVWTIGAATHDAAPRRCAGGRGAGRHARPTPAASKKPSRSATAARRSAATTRARAAAARSTRTATCGRPA